MRKLLAVTVITVALVSTEGASRASCLNNAPSKEASALWSKWNCQWDYVLWADKEYGSFGGHNWDDPLNGRQDACNTSKPFAKFINTTVLFTEGLTANSSDGMTRSFFTDGGLQWHGVNDYQHAADAPGNNFHDGVYYEVMNDVTPPPATSITWASEQRYCLWSPLTGCDYYEWTEMYCQVFDNAMITAGDSPSWRAYNMVHEGWHHWQTHNNIDRTHPAGCPGGGSCDYYYFHKISQYGFGNMWQTDRSVPLWHSPTQAGMEYLCDIAEEGTNWVGPQMANFAQLQANFLIANQFVNPVGWSCGTSRIPFYP